MFSRLIYQPKDFASLLRNVRSYYKPKQKDAFFDVEGVVNKDLVLFRFEDSKNVRMKNILGMTMLPVWAYLGYFAFSLKRKMEPFKEGIDSSVRHSMLIQNVTKASVGVGIGFFLFGAGLTSYWMMRTMNTVRKLVLKKGGKHVGIQTYGLLGGNASFMNVPVAHCCGIQHKFYGKHRFFLRVRDHSFKYSFNLEDGVFMNKPLFDRTVGVSRKF